MIFDFDKIIDLINLYLDKVDSTKKSYINSNVRKPYVDMVEKIQKELELFNVNIVSILDNLDKYVNDQQVLKIEDIDKLKQNNIFVDGLIKKENIIEYNLNLINRLKSLKINSIDEYFDDDIRFYEYLNDIYSEINRIRLSFLKHYRDIKKGSSNSLLKIESEFYNYIDNKVEFVDRYTKNIEDKINSLSLEYNNAYKNIENINGKYTKLSSNINSIYNDINEFNDRLVNANKNIDEHFIALSSDIEQKFNEKKKNLYSRFHEVKAHFDDEVDEIKKTITQHVTDIGETSKKFKEFISDETSIKLTNNFKTKSETERNLYYGFNLVSSLIIIFAICMSYTSLTDFTKNHAENFTQLDLYYLAIRLLFSFLIFSTVAFTNKLANKHYYHWKKNESTYLKLTALKSFIADMSPEKQQEIHEKLIDVYFGKEDLDPTIYKKIDNSSNDLIKFFTDKGVGLVNSKKID